LTPHEFKHVFPAPEWPPYWLTRKFPINPEGKAPLLGTVSINIADRVLAQAALENLYEDLDERFLDRTDDFNILASATAISEVRMAGLKKVIKKLCKQLIHR